MFDTLSHGKIVSVQTPMARTRGTAPSSFHVLGMRFVRLRVFAQMAFFDRLMHVTHA
jgi:hypothetical protein